MKKELFKHIAAALSAIVLASMPGLTVAKACCRPDNGWNSDKTVCYKDSRPCRGLARLKEGTFYFLDDGKPAKGALEVDGTSYYFDTRTGIGIHKSWVSRNGNDYWYENGIRQGVYGDPLNIRDTIYGVERGREIFDPGSNAWYWLDADNNGAKAKNKDVWLPYMYQNEKPGSTNGKWVRYDAQGAMLKGIQYSAKFSAWYYFDTVTGAMAKGWRRSSSNGWAYYDMTTGKLKEKPFMMNGIQYKPLANGSIGTTLHFNVPYCSQRDSRWASFTLGGRSLAASGCGVCVAASLINYFTSRGVTPPDVAKMFYAWNCYNGSLGHGTSGNVWRKVAARYDLSYCSNLSIAGITEQLTKGRMVIGSVASAPFVRYPETHALLLYGIDPQARTYVTDPYNSANNGWYYISDIFRMKSSASIDTMDQGPFYALGY